MTSRPGEGTPRSTYPSEPYSLGSFLGGYSVPPFPTGLDLAMGAPCGRLSSFGTTSRRERVLGRPFSNGRSLELEPVDQEEGGRADFDVFHCGNEIEDVSAGVAGETVVGILPQADSELSRAVPSVKRARTFEAIASSGETG